jgi:hypothetical protein
LQECRASKYIKEKSSALKGGKMKVISKEQVLADNNGWSLAQAQGYIDGQNFRRRGKTPSTYARVGIDEYCLGFRAGYYDRKIVQSMYPAKKSFQVFRGGRVSLNADFVEPTDAIAVSVRSG